MKKHIIFLTLTALLAAFVAACNDNGTDDGGKDDAGELKPVVAPSNLRVENGSPRMGRRKFGIRGGLERHGDACHAEHLLRHRQPDAGNQLHVESARQRGRTLQRMG